MLERLSFFLKRFRPWRADDFVALFSWIFLGHTLFFILGTTAFVSSLLFLADSLQFQGMVLCNGVSLSFLRFNPEYVARRIGNYLTKETGVVFQFESAIVPNWKEGTIRARNVRMSRLFR